MFGDFIIFLDLFVWVVFKSEYFVYKYIKCLDIRGSGI